MILRFYMIIQPGLNNLQYIITGNCPICPNTVRIGSEHGLNNKSTCGIFPQVQLVEKVCFFKKVLVLNPYPQTPFPGKGAILLGLPPLVQARMLAVSHTNHCTMQWHKWLTTCTGATPLRPHFYIIKRFIDSLKPCGYARLMLYQIIL